MGAHPIHLVMIVAGEQEDELGVAGLEHGAAVEQSLVEERFAERQRAGLGDDRLVQVEKGRGVGAWSGACRCLLASLLLCGRVEGGHRPSIGRWSRGAAIVHPKWPLRRVRSAAAAVF